jgi:hypothetical protein
LLQRRHGGDAMRLQAMLDWLYPVRDKVLDHAALHDGDVLLNVGTSDGLRAFGALERNSTCRVIFSDTPPSFGYPPPHLFHGYDDTPTQDLATKLRAIDLQR